MITLNQLANALALQEHSNFRRAADAQHLSQPAFSRSIQKLEESLGAKLFDRQTSGIKPTIYGEALLKRASTILMETHEIERETRLLKKFEIGSLSLAMGFFASEISGCKAIAEMVRLHPDLRCQITVDDWRDVEEMVEDRLVDIGFAGIKHIKKGTNLHVEPVGDYDFVFFCRNDHPLLKIKNPSKSDLDDYPVIAVRIPPQMADIFPGKCYIDEKSDDLTPAIKAGDQAAARTIVAGSNAISVTTPLQIEPWLDSGELKVLDFYEPWMKVDYGFIYRHDRMLAPAAEAFMQYVREIESEAMQRNQSLFKKMLPGFNRRIKS